MRPEMRPEMDWHSLQMLAGGLAAQFVTVAAYGSTVLPRTFMYAPLHNIMLLGAGWGAVAAWVGAEFTHTLLSYKNAKKPSWQTEKHDSQSDFIDIFFKHSLE